ncbi:MAG: hypothetical protein ABIS47_02640, partial [Acidimicrobiales bacterium]
MGLGAVELGLQRCRGSLTTSGRLNPTADEISPRDRSTSPTDHHQPEGAAMSRVRIHNFSISLDG